MAALASFHGLCQGLAVTALAAGGLFAAMMAGPASGPVAAVFPPWWDGFRTVNAASQGGAILGFGLMNFVVLVAPADQNGRTRLWQAGAWLLLNPYGFAACNPATGVKSNGG